MLMMLTLHVMVFGAANPMKVLMQHVQEEPMPPSHRTELKIPRGVDEFVLACLRQGSEAPTRQRRRIAADGQHLQDS